MESKPRTFKQIARSSAKGWGDTGLTAREFRVLTEEMEAQMILAYNRGISDHAKGMPLRLDGAPLCRVHGIDCERTSAICEVEE